ncbi:MAG: ATP-dependent DNA helicase RecG [Burkholderiales bacterium PBB1]|nr:MAG: ATP-dependent DNA helicase RecG [Burkholderiales bacterium PBB1]
MARPATIPADARDGAAAAPVAKPKSVPQRAMEKLGLHRDIDLALHVPLRYEDETRLVAIAELRDGVTAQVQGVVQRCEIQLRNRRQLLVTLADGASDTLLLRFLHFYPSHQKALAEGRCVRVRGEARGGFFGLEMVHPSFKAIDGDLPLATSLTPVYPTSASLPQAYLRRAVASALNRVDLSENVPAELLPSGVVTLRDALRWLHHPPADASLAALEDRSHPAWQRLKFEELLAQQLSQLQAKHERAQQRAPRFKLAAGGLQEKLLAALPFSLTSAQRRVVEEIAADLQRARPDAGRGDATSVPMHRLLQGDVGSGKTVVAALAAAIAIHNGWQCALMAPTEILADQHFRKLVGWLEPLGITTAWLTGSRKGRGRREMLERVASGEAGLVVGTHAVIQDDVQFARLGLAIVDEQHRFGVAQRLALRSKLEQHSLEPHLLMMSATPIPRTLAMTMYADLDISTIDELPPGRTPIVTKLFADSKREAVVARIRDEVAQGKQVYWVCPLIEEAAEGDTAPIKGDARSSRRPFGERPELRNVIDTHQKLTEALPGVGVGLLHGRMKAADKAATMAQFIAGELSVLVATTVIEVGVDVPNASLMVIEHAERFGLSQLHQLRGRVGRGSVASVCVLLYAAPLSDTGKARLKAMAETTDGFEIARRDLEIRGPGEFLGARQSGAALLRFADLNDDLPLLHAARAAAEIMLKEHHDAAERQVQRWLGSKADYLKA